MSPDMTLVGSLFCGVSVLVLLFTIYVHAHESRVAATRFALQNGRRPVQQHPAHQVLWRAFRMSMNHRKHGPAKAFVRNKDVRNAVPALGGAHYSKLPSHGAQRA